MAETSVFFPDQYFFHGRGIYGLYRTQDLRFNGPRVGERGYVDSRGKITMTHSVAANPRAVVFDLDGLMFNTEELYNEVGSELLRRRGAAFSGELKDAMMGLPGRVAFQVMIDWHGLHDTVASLAEESEAIFAHVLDSRLALMPGLADLLDALESAGFPKGIATSSSRRFTSSVLGRFELEPRFLFLLTAEDVIQGKPHPEIYLKAAERLGLAPADILVLEDSQNGCRAAVAAGTRAVAVPSLHSRHHDFAGAALIANGLSDERIYRLLGLSADSPRP